MTLWKTYYHLVWATHNRLPLITTASEPELYSYITRKSKTLDCPLHAIGGMADHIHLVVSIPPRLSTAEFVKHVKGSSSRFMNRAVLNQEFAWQQEYGVFSLGGKQLEQAIAYVNNQKQHHANTTCIRTLEPDVLNSSSPPSPSSHH
jgi:putative transposase